VRGDVGREVRLAHGIVLAAETARAGRREALEQGNIFRRGSKRGGGALPVGRQLLIFGLFAVALVTLMALPMCGTKRAATGTHILVVS
jgi:hypothetical protein